MSKILELLTSKKVLAGPASATALLATGQIDGWQWTAVTLGYVLIQGAVDVVKERLAAGNRPIDQQDGPNQLHP